jgi:hypothetical protein
MLIATDRAAHVHISTMTGKLAGIFAVNTNTMTNTFCTKMSATDAICGVCYSRSMLQGSRKNCAPAFERNSVLLSAAVIPAERLPVINAAIFRFHGHGELINPTHLENFYRIAERNPGTIFSLWTKRRDLVRSGRAAPQNFILIYSNPSLAKIMRTPPPRFHKVFNNVPADYVGPANCTGQRCIECKLCFTPGGVDVIVEHVKKRS